MFGKKGKGRNNKPKTEFRKANDKKNTGHPAYIYAKVGKKYKFIGITHADITKGVSNIPLDRNPDPNDKRQSYLRPKADSQNRSTFGKRLEGWHFGESDKPKVKKVIEDGDKPPKPKK
jgi:hypothetical protein